MIETPEPSWEVFDECPKCYCKEGQPCYNLRSTTWNLKTNKTPHRGRKQIKEIKWL